MTIGLVLLGAVFLVLIYGVMAYNRLIKMRNMVKEGWSGVDVHLKQRFNLIPNLVSAVKGYMTHEQKVLEDVTRLRAKSMNARHMEERSAAEGSLGSILTKVLAVAESYPQLKADANFRDLQQQLSSLEEQIQMARRYYNGCVRNYNTAVESFPSNVIANWFQFKPEDFFELDEPLAREVPIVEF